MKEAHLHGNTQNIQGLECRICKYNFRTNRGLLQHLNTLYWKNTTTVDNNSHNTDGGNNHQQIAVPIERCENF